MKVQYNIDGMHNPGTEVEIGGTIYFTRNHYSRLYRLGMVVIEGGRLCLYFSTGDDLPGNLVARRHYMKLYPRTSMPTTTPPSRYLVRNSASLSI